jgi:hypothetical protein
VINLTSGNELPTVRELPLYQQLHNACGLASLLMLLNLPQNPRMEQFVSELTKMIKPLLPKMYEYESDFARQYALEYLLLKAQGTGNKTALYKYLQTRFSYAYEDQKAINNHLLTIKREKFLEMNMPTVVKAYDEYILGGSDFIAKSLLEDETQTVKTDIELKLLIEIFGYQYISTDSGDGTGALYFTTKQAIRGIQTLFNAMLNSSRFVLIGRQNHWLAMTGIYTKNPKYWFLKDGETPDIPLKELIICVNDPIIRASREYPLLEILEDSRFYIFENRNENLRWLWDELLALFKQDIQSEVPLHEMMDKEKLSEKDHIKKLNQLREEETKKTQNIKIKYAPLKISIDESKNSAVAPSDVWNSTESLTKNKFMKEDSGWGEDDVTDVKFSFNSAGNGTTLKVSDVKPIKINPMDQKKAKSTDERKSTSKPPASGKDTQSISEEDVFEN